MLSVAQLRLSKVETLKGKVSNITLPCYNNKHNIYRSIKFRIKVTKVIL